MKKIFKTFLFLLVLFLVYPVSLFAETINLTKDTVIEEKYTAEDLTITGNYTITFKAGLEITGALVIKDTTVISEHPGITAGSIKIENATVNSLISDYGAAIKSTSGDVIITNSSVVASATDYGDYGIKSSGNLTITNSTITASTTGDISIAGLDAAESLTVTDSILNINTVGTGVENSNGDITFTNVKGNIISGGEGIASNYNVYLNNSDLNIDAASIEASAGLDPTGIFAYESVVIDGGKVVIKATKDDGIYANQLIEIKSSTPLVDVTGKTNALSVWVKKDLSAHGNIVIGNGLTTSEEVVFDETKGYLLNSSNNKVSHIVIRDPNYVEPSIEETPTETPEDKPVVKKTNTLKVKVTTKTVKYKSVKKKKQVVKSINILKSNGKITYTKLKGSSSKLTISKTSGKITVKKGTRKGKYKIKVKVSAAGDKLYKSGSKTVTVTIKVK